MSLTRSQNCLLLHMVNTALHLAPTVPRNVQVAIIAGDEAQVTWQPPQPPNGVVTQYDVRLTDFLSGVPLTVAIPANQTPQASVSVVQGVEYSVQVRARNGQLIGPYSNPVTFIVIFVSTTTPPPPPSGAVSTQTAPPTSLGAPLPSVSSLSPSPTPPSGAVSTQTAPPTSLGVPLPSVSSLSPSPTPPITADRGELSQQEIIVVVVCCVLLALVLLLLAACAGYMARRRCRNKPDKSLKYKCKSPQANRP